jgi:hypothetical protein
MGRAVYSRANGITAGEFQRLAALTNSEIKTWLTGMGHNRTAAAPSRQRRGFSACRK